jgi:hypothetical protein
METDRIDWKSALLLGVVYVCIVAAILGDGGVWWG